MLKLSKVARKIKYTIVTDILSALIKNSALLDGDAEPPRFINFVGAGNFIETGDTLIKRLIQTGCAKDGDHLLEIGCGIGRNATALQRSGLKIKYDGFDIVAYGIKWCEKYFLKINERNYRFEHSDVFNSFYNPHGKLSPENYAFGYERNNFDVIFATSVFTHMQSPDVYHYLSESNKCLKLGGKAFFTFFILDADSRESIGLKRSTLSFSHYTNKSWVEYIEEPDVAVAFDETEMQSVIAKMGFKINEFHKGTWRGNNKNIDYQDVLILEKIDGLKAPNGSTKQ